MRDLLFFLACCGLAATFWQLSGSRVAQREAAMQAELAQLGAPQEMDDSPERSLLRGDYLAGLQASPSESTYDQLAPLFLVSHELGGSQVLSSAFLPEGMGRALGDRLQFFQPDGRSSAPRLSRLSRQGASSSLPPFTASGQPALIADEGWLVYRDKVRWAAFRFWNGELDGWVSGEELTVEGDLLKMKGGPVWAWAEGRLTRQ